MTKMKRNKKIAVINDNTKGFVSILIDARVDYDIFDISQLGKISVKEYCGVIICNNNYPHPLSFSRKQIITINNYVKSGGSLFLEYCYYPDLQFLIPHKAVLERVFLQGNHFITSSFTENTILDFRQSHFLPIRKFKGKILASIGKVSGTYNVRKVLSEVFPGIVEIKKGKGRILYSAFPLSRWIDGDYKLQTLWRELMIRFCANLVSMEEKKVKEALSFFQQKTNYFKISNKNRKQVYREALAKNIEWFFHSGVISSLDGTQGVYEKVSGFPDFFGKLKLLTTIRTDCNLETAMYFDMYSQVSGDNRYREIAFNIIKYLYKLNYQDLDEKSISRGFWKWGWIQEPLRTPPYYIWADDNSWAAMVMLYFYQETGEKEYLKRAVLTLDALYETQSCIGLRSAVIHYPELQEYGKKWIQTQTENKRFLGSCNPHWDGLALSAFFYGYLTTKNHKYLEMAEKGLKSLCELYPKISAEQSAISRTSDIAFILMPLSLAYKITKKEKYKKELLHYTNYLIQNQVECGAIREAGNPRPETYGIGDVGVFEEENESICDLLYTVSFVVMNLYLVYRITGDETILKSFEKLMDFLVNIQINSKNPMLKGGWARGFDFKHWEYYGSNADTDWGPYCIETGWANAIIGIALCSFLLNETFFPIK